MNLAGWHNLAFAALWLAYLSACSQKAWLFRAGAAPRLAVALAAGLWCLAFGMFVVRYAPMLWRARVDGRPG